MSKKSTEKEFVPKEFVPTEKADLIANFHEHREYRFVKTKTWGCRHCALRGIPEMCIAALCGSSLRRDKKDGFFIKRDESQFPYGMKVVDDEPGAYSCWACAYRDIPGRGGRFSPDCRNCLPDLREDGRNVHFEVDTENPDFLNKRLVCARCLNAVTPATRNGDKCTICQQTKVLFLDK